MFWEVYSEHRYSWAANIVKLRQLNLLPSCGLLDISYTPSIKVGLDQLNCLKGARYRWFGCVGVDSSRLKFTFQIVHPLLSPKYTSTCALPSSWGICYQLLTITIADPVMYTLKTLLKSG